MTIRERNGRLEVVVYLGADPTTGKDRRVSRTVRGTNRVAWRAARELEVQLRREPAPSGLGDPTVDELFERWAAVARKETSGSTKARGDFDRYIKPTLGKVKVRRLTIAPIDALYVQLEHRQQEALAPLSASTVHGAHRTLHAMLAQAVVWGLPSNPASAASPPMPAKPNPTPPHVDDVIKLYLAAVETAPDLAVFIRLAASTGSRRGEVCGLRWADVDFDRAILRRRRALKQVTGLVYIGDTKTRAHTAIALDPTTLELLQVHHNRMITNARTLDQELAPDAYIFSTAADGTIPWTPGAATQRFGRLRKTCGLEHVKLKELRHFAATAMYAEGIAATVVSGRLSHARTSTAHDIYAAWSPVADRAAAQLLGNLLDG